MYNSYFSPYQNQNILPAQQVLQANGKASVDAIRMAPNSSALIMDTTAPVIWMCTSDSLGNVTSVAYDITPHKTPEEIKTTGIEERLCAVEKSVKELIERMEEDVDEKPDARYTKPKSSGWYDAADTTD